MPYNFVANNFRTKKTL